MANLTGAFGLEGLGSFLQNFAAARQQKALMQQHEDEFNQQIAQRLAEMQAEQSKQQYEDYQKAQEQLRTNLEAGTIQNQFDPMGKLIGKTGARLTPEAVTGLNQALVTGLQSRGNPFIKAEAANTLPFAAVPGAISPNAPVGFKPPTQIGLPGAFGLKPATTMETKLPTKGGQESMDENFGKFYASIAAGQNTWQQFLDLLPAQFKNIKTRNRAIQYWEQHNTLKGFDVNADNSTPPSTSPKTSANTSGWKYIGRVN